uniref:MYND-type domain-containing protein n=1 Tax=Tetradesmus obliquus TaxID=3088 RepID=A0A383VTG2_TETOB|eukprot:jgi/Sobl393_1/2442/SZX68064.1
MMKHEDWRELSSVMSSISSLYSSGGSRPPALVLTLELLLKLGQVTSCLLSLNGDDPAFSVARVAQAIKTTTAVLESCHHPSEGWGLPPELADSLARQRCEQTSLLQAMAWALRTEARALFFNPRPTALSLATALLDLFRCLERIWPDDIFAPPADEAAATEAAAAATAGPAAAAAVHPASSGDPAAARLADPAAQLAMAMLRCAGRAMGEVGGNSSKQIMLSGLRVADDLMHQISSLMLRVEGAAGAAEAHQPLVRELLQSPSILQLMLAMLAIQTQRLQQQLGMEDSSSFAAQHPVEYDAVTLQGRLAGAAGWSSSSSLASSEDGSCSCSCGACRKGEAAPSGSKQQPCTCVQQQQLGQKRLDGQPGVQQQQRKKQQGPQYVGAAGGSSEEEDDEHAGDGGLHQLWNQVLGMTGKPAADDSSQQQQEQQPATPLLQFWAALGLPGPLLQLASCSDVFTRAADVEYVQACRVARFLLQGASHLQPSSGREPAGNNKNSTTHAAQRRRSSTGGDVVSRTDRAALDLAGDHASTAAARGVFVVRSSKGFSLSPGSPASPASPRTPNSPREDEEEMNDLGRPGAVSPSAATAAHLVDDCRDYGFRGQEELEVLSLQQQLPLMLLDTAVALSSGKFDGPLAAQQCAALQHVQHQRRGSLGSSSSLARLSSSSCSLPPSPLELVSAACAAAAYSARCWPVLQKVGAVQKDGSTLNFAQGAPPGLFRLSSVTWQQYDLQPDSHLPVQELLQLVVQVVQQLLGQQGPQQQQQQHQERLLHSLLGKIGPKEEQQGDEKKAAAAAAGSDRAAGDAAANATQPDQQLVVPGDAAAAGAGAAGDVATTQPISSSTAEATQSSAAAAAAAAGAAPAAEATPAATVAGEGAAAAPAAAAVPPSRAPLSPRTREALWGLLEVLTAVSKLPWEPDAAAAAAAATAADSLQHEHHHHHHHHHHHADIHQHIAADDDAHLHGGGLMGVHTAAAAAAAADSLRPLRTRRSRQQQMDALYTAAAWRAMCRPVAAAVEAVLRSCSGTSAVVPRTAARGTGMLLQAAAAAAAGQWHGRERQSVLHPATVALSSCLASTCAPLGRPGPLVAAVAGSAPCSTPQLQLFALLASKIKLMMTDTSGRKELFAMHPIEQTPVYILDSLARQLQQQQQQQQQQQHHAYCTPEGASGDDVDTAGGDMEQERTRIAAAAVPWLLLLGRLIKLRGRLLGELLQRDREAAGAGHGSDSSSSSVTATLHNAFWHVQMAMASAMAVEKHVGLLGGMHSSAVGSVLAAHAQALLHSEQHQQQQPAGQQVDLQNGLQDSLQDNTAAAAAAAAAAAGASPVGGFDLQQVLQQLQQELLPALKHAVQLLKAAMKLARHYHETGFASGFAAGFAAGYAAAVAATTGQAGHSHSLNFASPAGVLQQGCVRELPAQLKGFGGVLSGQLLVPFCCSNPLCLNTATVSELGLLGDGSCGSVRAVLCSKCGAARYCSIGCRAQHKSRHKPLCKQLCARMEQSRAAG